MKENLFYVGIKDAVGMRRSLLNSSKDIIDSLRSYESFKKSKEKKHALITQFKDALEETAVLIAKLRSHLPKTSFKPELLQGIPKSPSAQVSLLEQELKKVEERLRELE